MQGLRQDTFDQSNNRKTSWPGRPHRTYLTLISTSGWRDGLKTALGGLAPERQEAEPLSRRQARDELASLDASASSAGGTEGPVFVLQQTGKRLSLLTHDAIDARVTFDTV